MCGGIGGPSAACGPVVGSVVSVRVHVHVRARVHVRVRVRELEVGLTCTCERECVSPVKLNTPGA